ncbi:hypothetical protein [Micromonospora sp. NPDC049204]|uniref:hypothetical protein n=1 Tax=Micromonospora sp. NPDC049204 TaxID=3154351 RepID=UPI0033BFD51F
MAVDPVPWFVGGGAQHSPEVARQLAYAAFRGNEGVLGSGDLLVRPLSVPGAGVRVLPGACAINNRAAGGEYQAYSGRVTSQEVVAVSPTGSGSGRSDLIVMRVEDPFMPGEPWQDPEDEAIGPYLFARRIAGVPSGTRTVAELGLGYSAIALARIDLGPSTGTVTSVVDLRRVANPRRERRVLVSSPLLFPESDDVTSLSEYIDWPDVHVQPVDIPLWATQAKVVTHVGGALVVHDKTDGFLRNRLGTQLGQGTVFDTNAAVPSDGVDRTLLTADEMTIPSAMRGTTQDIALQAILTQRGTSGLGTLRAYEGTTVITDIEFVEIAES